MQTKGEAAAIQSVLFYLPGLHCRGSFEMLAVIPASNEWCRIGSCCLSMFEFDSVSHVSPKSVHP